MSEPAPQDAGRPERQPSLADRALDLFVFAPAGAVLSALEDVPGMAARGRARLEQEVRNAHLVGRFAVGEGQRRLKRVTERLASGPPGGPSPAEPPPTGGPTAAGAASPVPTGRPAPAEPSDGQPAPATRTVAAGEGDASSAGGDEESSAAADRAIPGYDSLSASQVVRRLDGLGPGELAAVFRHESATRGRRTILHRAQQLIGPSGQRPSAGT